MRALLTEQLAHDPNDAEARAELERLNQGLPLRVMESPLARKRREEQEMQEELEGELALYRSNPAILNEWEPTLLNRRRKRVALIRARVGKRLPADTAAEATAYLSALSGRLSRHHGRYRRWLLLGLGVPLLTVVTAGGGMLLHQRAEKAEAPLRDALRAKDPERIESALRAAESGINRLVHRKLDKLIDEAQNWQAWLERLQEQLHRELSVLETSEAPISALPLRQRASIEHKLRALPPSLPELRERWQRLCDKEARTLAAQRDEAVQRFSAPLPPLPPLSKHPTEDDALLKAQQQQLQRLAEDWKDAHALFHLDPRYGEELSERLAELRQLREDIAALRRTIALLPSARSYAQYRSRLEQLQPKQYAPALRMEAIRDLLPDEDKLRNLMQDHGRRLPPGMLEAARRAHLDMGPSFPPAFPANAEQVQLMEDVFTYSGLQKELYQLSAPTLPTYIVEERPEVTHEHVSFHPSPLSPGYSLNTPQRITWHNPQAVAIRRVDTTALLLSTGIARERFFSEGNMPSMLDTLLRISEPDCPALARAYIFKRLLEVMAAHEWPTMLGIAYAPTLRADAQSFARLTRGLPIQLEPGCWFPATEDVARAESACARWFRERRHRHYADEIKRNFGSLVEVHPRYIGYIDEEGKPRLFSRQPEGTLLWYVGQDGLTATPQGEVLEGAVIFTPVFIVAKN